MLKTKTSCPHSVVDTVIDGNHPSVLLSPLHSFLSIIVNLVLVNLNYHVVNEVVKVGICRKGRKVRTLNIFCLPIDSSMISFEAPFIGLSLSYSQNCKVYHVQKMFTILLKMKLLDLSFKITNLLKRFSRLSLMTRYKFVIKCSMYIF